jgi:hypothetical protein
LLCRFAKMLRYTKSDMFSPQKGSPNYTKIVYARFEGTYVPIYLVHLSCSCFEENFAIHPTQNRLISA